MTVTILNYTNRGDGQVGFTLVQLLVVIAILIALLLPAEHALADPPFRLVYEAEWNDVACTDYPISPEKWAAECIAPLVNTQVDCLLYNLCSSDGYCCQLDNGEYLMDAFEKLPDAWVWRYRENTKHLVAHDANPPKLACEYGHRLGLKVIPIVRMNDMHDMFYLQEVSRFKLDNPQLLLGSTGPDWRPDWKAVFSNGTTKTTDSFRQAATTGQSLAAIRRIFSTASFPASARLRIARSAQAYTN